MAVIDPQYEVYTNEKGQHMVSLNGDELPGIIETVIKQDADMSFSGVCVVKMSVIAKVKIQPIE